MKSFNDNESTKHNNPFSNIKDEYFNKMLEEGFEEGTLDTYSKLTGSICYKKSFESSVGWWVTCYITEKGMAVDHDYDCGGNSSNNDWWFEDGEYTVKEFNYDTYEYDESTYTTIGITFEEAWDSMIEYAKSF